MKADGERSLKALCVGVRAIPQGATGGEDKGEVITRRCHLVVDGTVGGCLFPQSVWLERTALLR